jgi:5-methylcytosine-specific restriction endonuclease McrA
MDTLVLSHAYQPLDRISWQRAITLWVLDKVEILEEYEDRTVGSVSFSIKMPAVVRFVYAVKIRMGSVKFSRENVFARDKGRCQYCRKKLTRKEATYDHVVPRRFGGPTRWDNIVLACVPCNQRKGGRTPAQAGMKLAVAPVRPKSLPPTLRFTLPAPGDMPVAWKQYFYDLKYWHGELEHD